MLHLAVAINDKDRDLIPVIVSVWTLSKSYHTELVFTDGNVLICDPSGVRMGTRVYDRYHWVMIPLPWINHMQEKCIRKWCEDMVAQKPKYDWLGAIFGGIATFFDNPRKWFCSELCCAALKDYTPVLQEDATTNPFAKRKWWTPELLWRTLAEYLMEYDPKYGERWKFRYKNSGAKSTEAISVDSSAENTE